MTEIKLCANEDCDLSWTCWRFNFPTTTGKEEYGKFKPKDDGDYISCENFMKTPKIKKEKLK